MKFNKKELAILAFILVAVNGYFLLPNTTENGEHDSVADKSGTSTTENVPTDGVEPTPTAVSPTQPTSVKSPAKTTPSSTSLAGKSYKELVRPTGFFNTNTLNLVDTNAFTLKEFVGKKVILLNFWTSSSVNSLRTFTYLNHWNSTYKDKGLMVISIHTPRFAYERTQDIVAATTDRFRAIHPIVLDNNYETWNAYGNKVWPKQFLIDINGKIAYEHVGEGGYEGIEAKIQTSLSERYKKLGLGAYQPSTIVAPEDAIIVDATLSKTPELFFGATGNSTLGNGIPTKEGQQDFKAPSDVAQNKFYLVGSWNFTKESVKNLSANTSILTRYHSKMVSGVFSATGLVKAKVKRDGSPLSIVSAGKDIRFDEKTGESYFFVKESRVYDIVNDKTGYGEHSLEITFENSGVVSYLLNFD
jgi:thiol-disulfide isomerase/thioredoxin